MSLSADRREMLALSGAALLLPALGGKAEAAGKTEAAAPSAVGGRDQPFDDDWRFYRGEGAFEAPNLDDSGWRRVDLPHDWSIEDVPGGSPPDELGPFDKKAIGATATGYTLGGEGWYRKRFALPRLAADARVEVVFDGAYTDTEVWLNGAKVGEHFHGYAPFAVDLTPALNRAGENVLAVRVRNLGKNSRWYSGSGLYRQATLDVLPGAARFARWGIAAWTRRIENGRADVQVTTRIEAAEPGLTITARLRDRDGRVAVETSGPATSETVLDLALRGPHLWSPADPYLYSLETELRRGNVIIDQTAQQTGLRIVTIDPQSGLRVNGRHIVLRGGCIHHDNGLLGACAYADADERRVRLLQARGYNAIRSSHNPASRSLRGACDRLGMLLIDEAFDMWHVGKNPDDYAKHFTTDWENPLSAMVLSARNSPSVIMWSIGNEIPARSTPEGIEWSWKLANTVRRLDPTRPVTAALNGLLGPLVKVAPETARPGKANVADNAAAVFLDVAGYNYRLENIEQDHAAHPDRVIYASETYAKNAYDYAEMARRLPYMLGEFLWTAMDYLGEAGIGAALPIADLPFYLATWPWVNAWCGDIDLIGDQKAPSRYRDVVWGLSKLELAVQRPLPEGKKEFVSAWGWSDELQSWSWPGHEGKPMPVRLYTAGDRIELLLNGAKVGEKMLGPTDKLRAEIIVPYAAGTLEAVAFAGGHEIARKRLVTVGAPARLRLRPESLNGGSGRRALSYVAVDVLDEAGRQLPDEARTIALSIDGPAELAGFGSASPYAVGSFQASEAQCFRGRALAILRGTGRKGAVRMTARSEGLTSASVVLQLT